MEVPDGRIAEEKVSVLLCLSVLQSLPMSTFFVTGVRLCFLVIVGQKVMRELIE